MTDLHGDGEAEDAAEDGVHPQFAMFEIIDGFQDHDALGLRSLTPDGRAKQLAARQELYDYVTDLWEHAPASWRSLAEAAEAGAHVRIQP